MCCRCCLSQQRRSWVQCEHPQMRGCGEQTSLSMAVKRGKCLGPPPSLLLASACIGSVWSWEVQSSTLLLQHRTETKP